jgi:hypothetical protein
MTDTNFDEEEHTESELEQQLTERQIRAKRLLGEQLRRHDEARNQPDSLRRGRELDRLSDKKARRGRERQ